MKNRWIMVKLTKELIRAIINDKLNSFLEKDFSQLSDEEKFRTLNSKESNFIKNLPSVTPLMVACAKGDVMQVRKLIDLGAKVNFANNESQTALHIACLYKKLEAVKALMENGAEINKQCRKEHSSLYYALATNLNKDNEELVKKEKEDSLNIVQYLLEKNVNVNQVNANGFNSFIQYLEDYKYFFSSNFVNTESLHLLLKAGLDLKYKTPRGQLFTDLLGFRGEKVQKQLQAIIDEFLIYQEKDTLENLVLINNEMNKKEKSFKI